jgi:hypothetical protein
MLKRNPKYPDYKYLYEREGNPWYHRRVPRDAPRSNGKGHWTEALGQVSAYPKRHAEIEEEIRVARQRVQDERRRASEMEEEIKMARQWVQDERRRALVEARNWADMIE